MERGRQAPAGSPSSHSGTIPEREGGDRPRIPERPAHHTIGSQHQRATGLRLEDPTGLEQARDAGGIPCRHRVQIDQHARLGVANRRTDLRAERGRRDRGERAGEPEPRQTGQALGASGVATFSRTAISTKLRTRSPRTARRSGRAGCRGTARSVGYPGICRLADSYRRSRDTRGRSRRRTARSGSDPATAGRRSAAASS